MCHTHLLNIVSPTLNIKTGKISYKEIKKVKKNGGHLRLGCIGTKLLYGLSLATGKPYTRTDSKDNFTLLYPNKKGPVLFISDPKILNSEFASDVIKTHGEKNIHFLFEELGGDGLTTWLFQKKRFFENKNPKEEHLLGTYEYRLSRKGKKLLNSIKQETSLRKFDLIVFLYNFEHFNKWYRGTNDSIKKIHEYTDGTPSIIF